MDPIPEEPPKSLASLLWQSLGIAFGCAAAAHLIAFFVIAGPTPDALAPLVGLASGLVSLAVLLARRDQKPRSKPSARMRRASANSRSTPDSNPSPPVETKRSRYGLPAMLGLTSLGLFAAAFLLLVAVPHALAATGIRAELLFYPILLLAPLALICGAAGALFGLSALIAWVARLVRADRDHAPIERRRRAARRRERAERKRTPDTSWHDSERFPQ